ncbi:phosphoribosylglycinamide formyltransferase [Allochromatium palmeri]|uniref:Phosphoribosylglycinamide formyltransferase n=1 Tax=Allochromatium palmeri TaxID=231048 RepID=A0A6N8EC31_9GAMM|nr:phosphoribosylglycinamide formyltransferase [Allochromatium palmeri]MTW21141.1 phosphoribosylglycinamide formyltransferase [Allochromatium palmeri]
MPSKPVPLAVVALVSGSGSNLQALIDAQEQGAPFQIRAVISNEPGAFGLERARRHGLPAEILNHRDYPDRASFDAALSALIDGYDPGLVVLAGFMRILTPAFVEHYPGRMLNIHPSLLPKYQGLHTHQRALDAGEVEHGASVHFVTAELDGGPVILQARVPVLPGDDAGTLAARVLKQEHVIYPTVVRWFAEGRLRLSQDGRPVLDGGVLAEPRRIGLGQGRA